MQRPDYGWQGRVGIATPQANKNVEDEFRILLPPAMGVNFVRLRGRNEPKDRLCDYLDNLSASLATFDTFKPAALGFACTGTSYLIGESEERRRFGEIAQQVGYPIVTATQAIAWALDRLGAKRIALIGPYPQWLIDAGERYWREQGRTVVSVTRVETGSADTRSIYGLTSDRARPVLQGLDISGVDAVLVSGTGMPSLPLIADSTWPVPIISSNYALAARLVGDVLSPDKLDARLGIAGWRERLGATLAG